MLRAVRCAATSVGPTVWGVVAEPVRVRRLTDQEGQKLQQIVRRGSTSSVRFRHAMLLLASAGGNRVPVIAQLVQPMRTPSKPQPVGPRPPSARAVTRWILTHPDALAESDRLQLKAVLAKCPELDAPAEHVQSLPHMLTHLQGHQLPAWIEGATAADLPSLQRFARHLERDLDAVTAGLSQP